MPETIQPASITQEVRRRYLTYALSVITARAVPDVRDGLKPVQRRILYTMYNDLHLTADGRPRKCAKIVGDVTGNYHPHGTLAAYEALVRLAQPFVMRVPLVDAWLHAHLAAARFEPARSQGKAAFVRQAAPELPAALFDRPKTGFYIPVMEWLDAETARLRPGRRSRRLALQVLEEMGIWSKPD